MEKSAKILSDIVIHNKYAKYLPDLKRRETFEEICNRNLKMHIQKFSGNTEIIKELNRVYRDFVKTRKILPSMRSMQFAGRPIELSPNRLYNCAYINVDHPAVFSETMFLLLGGSGVGYSVQQHHVDQLPAIHKSNKTRRYLVSDSIEGWADAIKILMRSFFEGKPVPRFDFSDIRAKGSLLITSGGKAPGPQPLHDCVHNIKGILNSKDDGEQLSTLNVHDIMCHIADAVLAGGIRRAAMIALFDIDDNEMLTCKYGNWWEQNSQRGRANNSAVVLRHKITYDKFEELWERIRLSGSGEPGLYFTNDKEWGVNPCCFTGDSILKTGLGDYDFKHLSTLNNISVKDRFGKIREGKVWSNGIKDIVEVKNMLGETIRCTPDHVFMDNKGNEVQAKDLKKKRLMPDLEIRTKNTEFVKYGFIQGDGGLGRLTSPTHKGLEIHIGDKDKEIATLFGIDYVEGKRTYYTNGYNTKLKIMLFDSSSLPTRGMPETFLAWKRGQKKSFLRGMYSANGCVIKGTRVSYKTTSSKLRDELVETLQDLGIECYFTTNKSKDVKFDNGTYTCKESYDINIGKFNSIKKFAQEIGFVHEYKTIALKELLIKKSPLISSIKDGGKEEVFDFTIEDDKHWGIVNGYVAHNCEIALKSEQFCNLVEVNIGDVTDQEELNNRVEAATFLATLQASYTDFHYLRDSWRRNCEKDALIGVSMTGIASGTYKKLDLEEATQIVLNTNKKTANDIGINQASRTTCLKPAGTTSLVFGGSSGIHAYHAEYYIRRMRLGKDEAIYKYLAENHPNLVVDDQMNPKQAILEVPIKAPEKAIIRSESPLQLLERIRLFSMKWVKTGHIKGENTHNVSATVSIKDGEWEIVGDWFWNNRDTYNGLSVLNYDGGSYCQAPFEDCTKEVYEEMYKSLEEIDLTKVVEEQDMTDLSGEAACSGGNCEVK